MKNLYITILLCLVVASPLLAQQEEQYTQFMNIKQVLNPGFAGSEEALGITALSRNQWLGLDGAPQTQLISITAPILNQRIGVGGNIQRQSIGATEFYTIDGVYSYRIKVPRGFLGIGLQASVRLLRVDFGSLTATQPIGQDEAIPNGMQSKYVPNFGAGLYYNTRNFYLGFSVPRLLTSNIDLANSDDIIAREVSHAYFMSGVTIDLGEKLALTPQILLKYVEGAPFDADVNVTLSILDKISTGVSYRLGGSTETGFGEALSAILGFQISENIMLGLSYDATVSQLRDFNSGTIEGVFRYRVKGKSETEDVDNPRFFN
ncbi:MAG: type IX secretion system membrane protein PorP/SprF [Bacteroidota bacterium]